GCDGVAVGGDSGDRHDRMLRRPVLSTCGGARPPGGHDRLRTGSRSGGGGDAGPRSPRARDGGGGHGLERARRGPAGRRAVAHQPGRSPAMGDHHDPRRQAVAGGPAGHPGPVRRAGGRPRDRRLLGPRGGHRAAVVPGPRRVSGLDADGPAPGRRGAGDRHVGGGRHAVCPAPGRRADPRAARCQLQHPPAGAERRRHPRDRGPADGRSWPAGRGRRRRPALGSSTHHSGGPGGGGPPVLGPPVPVGRHVVRRIRLLRFHPCRLRRPGDRPAARRRRPGRTRDTCRPGWSPARRPALLLHLRGAELHHPRVHVRRQRDDDPGAGHRQDGGDGARGLACVRPPVLGGPPLPSQRVPI
ncbi:MAG: NLP/P60, partial [uncultured Acidimicrobiales bacterium]